MRQFLVFCVYGIAMSAIITFAGWAYVEAVSLGSSVHQAQGVGIVECSRDNIRFCHANASITGMGNNNARDEH